VFIGALGLLTASFRSLASLFMTEENVKWELNESRIQSVMLIVGVLGLFAIGLFPQILQPFLRNLPSLFEHLAQ
jgi:hypothetical protein